MESEWFLEAGGLYFDHNCILSPILETLIFLGAWLGLRKELEFFPFSGLWSLPT